MKVFFRFFLWILGFFLAEYCVATKVSVVICPDGDDDAEVLFRSVSLSLFTKQVDTILR